MNQEGQEEEKERGKGRKAGRANDKELIFKRS